jgi:hypothetical protein
MNAQAEPLLHPVARSNPQSGLPKWRVYRPHDTNRWRLPAVERIGRRQVEAGQLEPGIRATFCVTCRRLLTCILHALTWPRAVGRFPISAANIIHAVTRSF